VATTKNRPQYRFQDSNLQRTINNIYDIINDLSDSVRSPTQFDYKSGADGKIGDIRVFKDHRTGYYVLAAKTREGWVRIGMSRDDGRPFVGFGVIDADITAPKENGILAFSNNKFRYNKNLQVTDGGIVKATHLQIPTSAPANPTDGSIYWDESNFNMNVYIDDPGGSGFVNLISGQSTNAVVETIEMTSSDANEPFIKLINTSDGNTTPYIAFDKTGGTDGMIDYDFLSHIVSYGRNDNATPETISYSDIYTQVTSIVDGSESATLRLSWMQGGTFESLTFKDDIAFPVNLNIGANYISSDGTSAGLSLDVSNDATFSGGVTITGDLTVNGDILDIYVGGDNVMKIDEATGKLSFPVGIKEVHSGYHGNVLRSKILPSDFSTDSSRALIFDATTGGIKLGIAAADMWATVPIPTGYKATKVKLFGNNTRAFEVFETEIDLATKTSKGSGAVGTELDITDVDSTKDNFLVIQVALVATSEIIYGGYVTIAVI